MPQSCVQGMRSIGPSVAERFLEVIKCRNRLARSLGYIDYYDYKVLDAVVDVGLWRDG